MAGDDLRDLPERALGETGGGLKRQSSAPMENWNRTPLPRFSNALRKASPIYAA